MHKPVPKWQTILDFSAARDDGGGSGSNWNFTMFKAPVRSPSQHTSYFRLDALPVALPAVSKHWRQTDSQTETIQTYASYKRKTYKSVAVASKILCITVHVHATILFHQYKTSNHSTCEWSHHISILVNKRIHYCILQHAVTRYTMQ